MNVNNVELETVCGITSRIPVNTLPEIAFAGKSNVGKSSLINALINRKALARTSAKPGKTQTINFYNVEKKLYFVDLPGYGFANVSHEISEKWGVMIENYLNTSANLKAIFLLVDIRHEPSKNDLTMYDFVVQKGFKPIIIATKYDKISKNALNKQLKVIRETLSCGNDTVIIPFSAESKFGRDKIWETIEGFIR